MKKLRALISPGVSKHVRIVAIAAIVLTAMPVGFVVGSSGASGSYIAAALADPLAVIAGRSPGQRADGALTTSKPKLAASAGNVPSAPRERVLSNVRSRTPTTSVATVPAATGAGLPGATPFTASPSSAGVFVPALVSSTVGGSVDGSGGGLLGVGGTGFGGGGGFAIAPVTALVPEVPVVVSPIPEPATWMMMIGGFFLMAVAIRSNRRSARYSNRVSEPQIG